VVFRWGYGLVWRVRVVLAVNSADTAHPQCMGLSRLCNDLKSLGRESREWIRP
jgi:hypothetical protein